MCHSICGVLLPSRRADSSSSIGMSRTNTDITAIPIGRFSATCVSTSAVYVLSQPIERNITYHGPTSVIGGIMWNTSDPTSTAAGTQRGQRSRCSEYAASVAISSTSAVDDRRDDRLFTKLAG